jgi:hypothetical protein
MWIYLGKKIPLKNRDHQVRQTWDLLHLLKKEGRVIMESESLGLAETVRKTMGANRKQGK